MDNTVITFNDLCKVTFHHACELRRLGWISDEVWQPYMNVFNESDKSWWEVDITGHESVKQPEESWQSIASMIVWFISSIIFVGGYIYTSNVAWFYGLIIPVVFTLIMIWSRRHKRETK
jgi:hypothetical protein